MQRSLPFTLSLLLLLLSLLVSADELNLDDIVLVDQKTNSEIDLSIIITVDEDQSVYLRLCLAAIVAEARQEALSSEIFVMEVRSEKDRTIPSLFKRRDAIQTTIRSWKSDSIPISTLIPTPEILEELDRATATNTTNQTKPSTHYDEAFKGWQYSQGLNYAVSQSSGRRILVLSERTEVFPGFLKPLLSDDSTIHSSKLVQIDGSIFYAGIDYAFQKCPKQSYSSSTSYNPPSPNAYTPPPPRGGRAGRVGWTPSSTSQASQTPSEVPTAPKELSGNCVFPEFVYAGRSGFDTRVTCTGVTRGVSTASFVVRRQDWTALGGMNQSLSRVFALLDFGHRFEEISGKIQYNADSVATYHLGPENSGVLDQFSADEHYLFLERWNQKLSAEIRGNFELTNFTLIWSMECGTGQVLGFTTEALGFLSALYNKILIRVSTQNLAGCVRDLDAVGIPRSLLRRLEAASNVEVEGQAVIVLHHDPGRYTHFLANAKNGASWSQPIDPLFIIGRSMYETDKIPPNWVGPMTESVDHVWVPSHFNVKTFSENGIPQNMISVLPETVDVHAYDPAVVQGFPLEHKLNFNFLAIGKWEERKGWSDLLNAFWREFTSRDNVALYIRASLDEKNRAELSTWQKSFQLEFNRTTESLPRVEIIQNKLPYAKLPSLYKGVNAFVSASHGEGWGLPLIEAMAMELPTIAINWSGNTEFMDANNSVLVPVDKLVDSTTPGHRWAAASLDDFRQNMRYIMEHPRESSEIGKRARVSVHKFSEEEAKDRIVNKMRDIIRDAPALKMQKEQRKAELEALRKEREALKASKISIKINE